MNYDELTAKQLQELCRERNLDTARDKATMIQRLQDADEVLNAPDTSTDAVLPASEPEKAPEVQEKTPEPVQADPEPEVAYWVTPRGGFSLRIPRHGKLDDREHRTNLAAVKEAAENAGFEYYGPAFRVADPDNETWVYRIWVR